jgi:hypothetical protein
MSVATTTAVGLGIAGATGLAGSAIAAHGANQAAKTQADAAMQAAQIQSEDARRALDFTKQQYADSLRLMSPYYNMGTSALGNLGFLMGLRPSNAVLTSGGDFPTPAASSGSGMSPNFFGNPTTGQPAMSVSGAPGMLAVGTAPPSNTFSRPVIGNRMAPVSSVMTPDGGSTDLTANDNGLAGSGLLPAGPDGVMNQRMPLDEGGFSGPTAMPPSGPSSGLGPAVDPNTGLPSDNMFLRRPEDASGFGSLMQPFSEQFAAPTDVTEQNDPGFQFRLKQGQQALERSAAARGSLLTGGTMKDLTNYAQDYASNEYNNVYNRAMGEYLNRYNIFKQNQNDQFNRLAALAGIGQTSTSQLMGAGQNAASNVGNLLMTSGAQQAQAINNAAAARASGYAAGGNIWGNTLGNLGSLALLMKKDKN